MDTEIWDHYLALLFEKNIVLVYDLKHIRASKREGTDCIQFNKPIFKATFPDATDQITQLFFVKDFQRSADDDMLDSDEGRSRNKGYSSDDSEDAKYDSKSATRNVEGQQKQVSSYANKRL